MLRCFPCFSLCFPRAGPQTGRRARHRAREGGLNPAAHELIAYDELQIEEAAVRADQVAEAARNAETREVAPSLRDESLVARLAHALGGTDLDMEDSMDLSDMDERTAGRRAPSSAVFVSTLQTLKDKRVKCVVIESLWNATRHRWRKRETTRLLALFQIAISSCLSAKSQSELSAILIDLPPAVMGDDVAQQSSRVLIDVSRDAREEMMRRRAVLPQALRREVDSAVAAFDSQLKDLETNGADLADKIDTEALLHPLKKPFKPGAIDTHISLYFDILISLILELPEFDRFRIIMTQMLLSKQVPADTTLRTSVVELCFPSRPPTPLIPSSPNTPSIPTIAAPSSSSASSSAPNRASNASPLLFDPSSLDEEGLL